MVKSVYWSTSEVPTILVRYLWNFKFLGGFSTNTQLSNVMKILPVVPYGQTDGRSGTKNLIAAFPSFAKAPKKNEQMHAYKMCLITLLITDT